MQNFMLNLSKKKIIKKARPTLNIFSRVISSHLILNCLAYWYWYRPKFIIGCQHFLKKCKLTVRTKTLLLVVSIFLAVIFFASLWHFCHMSLDYLSSCVGPRVRAGKIRFSGARKSVLLKASSGERCVPRNSMHLVALRGTCLPHHVLYRAPNEICYEKMKQCNNILQFPHVRTERLYEKRKPRLCFHW